MSAEDFQTQKAVVRAHHGALAGASPVSVADALARHTAPDWLWRGMHPFDVQHGAEAVASAFCVPFLGALRRVQRREDIICAGLDEIDVPGQEPGKERMDSPRPGSCRWAT